MGSLQPMTEPEPAHPTALVGRAVHFVQAGFVDAGRRFRRSPAATRVALGGKRLTVALGPILLGAAASAGTNLAAHRCSNLL
jgi:hypothetical protein